MIIELFPCCTFSISFDIMVRSTGRRKPLIDKNFVVKARHLVAIYLLIKWSRLTKRYCGCCAKPGAIPVSPEEVRESLVKLGHEPLGDIVFSEESWNADLEELLGQLQQIDQETEVPATYFLYQLWRAVVSGYEPLIQNLMAPEVDKTLRRLLADALLDRLPTSNLEFVA
jgi:hypothetical protein